MAVPCELSIGDKLKKDKKIGRSDVDVKILKSILIELVLIRKELQVIRNLMESYSKIDIDGTEIAKAAQKAIHDIAQANE